MLASAPSFLLRSLLGSLGATCFQSHTTHSFPLPGAPLLGEQPKETILNWKNKAISAKMVTKAVFFIMKNWKKP